jgi:type I restriction enzyme S subunit
LNGAAFKPTDWSDEGLPIVRIQNLTDRTKPMNRTTRIVDPAYVVQPGDLLVSWSATLDAFIWDREPALLNQHIFKVVPNTELVSKKYLFFALRQAIREMGRTEHLHGSTMKHINRGPFLAHRIPVPPLRMQAEIVAELEKQFSRLDEAVASLKRVKANAQRFERATIEAVTSPNSFSTKVMGTVANVAVSLDNMREPVNKTERAKRVGTIPYLGANGQTGWIDEARFDEELVLVVEDETFVGRKLPFSYYFSGKCWVNNHTHVLRARRDLVLPKYLNLALSYYPFIPLTTGSTGRRKLTKAALMSVPINVPDLETQHFIIAAVDRRLSIVREVEAEVAANLKRAQALRQAVLTTAFGNTETSLVAELS